MTLFHLGFGDVLASGRQLGTNAPFQVGEDLIVAAVVFLDHLKRPPVRKHIAPYQVVLQAGGEPVMACSAQRLDRTTQDLFRAAGELMEFVQVSPSALNCLQSFGQHPDCLHGGIIRPWRSSVAQRDRFVRS